MLQYTARVTSQDTPRVGGRNLLKSLRGRDGSVTSMREITVDGDALLWKQLNKSTQPYTLLLHTTLTDGDYTLSYKCSVGENYRDYIYYYRADNGAGFATERYKITSTTTTKIGDGVWLHTDTFRGLVASKYKGISFYGTDPFDPAKEVRFWDFKLERGTVATDWTPAPEDVAESVRTVNTSLVSLASTLLDPEQGEIHKLTSQLTTSAQQTLAEAVKRAGEMDKQIKVGGRNLIRNSDKSLSNSLYFVGRYEISDPSLMEAGEDYTIRIWGEIEGADYSESIWVYNSGGNTEVASIQKSENGVWQMTFKWRDDSAKSNTYLNLFRSANHPNNKKSYNTTIKRIKLERGTIATDWTPATEDLDDRISNVSTSLTSLASTLLDPNEGDIPQLFRQLDKHKTDTDKSFAELSDHPLTIDDNGYWQIWNLKQKKYLTTQYPSRGRDGRNGTNGKDGQDGAKGADGKDGHTPVINWDGTKLIIDDKAPVDLRGQRGEAGHSPSTDEVLDNPHFAELLTQQVETSVDPKINKIKSGTLLIANNIQSQLCELGVLSISDSGYVKVKQLDTCPAYTDNAYVAGDMPPIEPKTHQIQLALKSDVAALRSTVTKLQGQLQRLAASTHITPIANTDLRKQGGGSTLYPQYGDWLLTSDSAEQYISFAGLPAEIGRSIYIQTRKRTYLYSSGHSFFGLPGDPSKGTAVNQWLSNNTTYRFVRASTTTWFVTASSSPYPWT